MKFIFLLSGDYIDLGAEEVASLFNIRNYSLRNRLMILNLDNRRSLDELSRRVALTKNIYKFLFECKVSDLIKIMKSFDWNSVCKHNFCLRKFHLDENNINGRIRKSNKAKIKGEKIIFYKNLSEINLAGYVWRSWKSPKVDLENPKTEINLFFLKGRIYCHACTFG